MAARSGKAAARGDQSERRGNRRQPDQAPWQREEAGSGSAAAIGGQIGWHGNGRLPDRVARWRMAACSGGARPTDRLAHRRGIPGRRGRLVEGHWLVGGVWARRCLPLGWRLLGWWQRSGMAAIGFRALGAWGFGRADFDPAATTPHPPLRPFGVLGCWGSLGWSTPPPSTARVPCIFS